MRNVPDPNGPALPAASHGASLTRSQKAAIVIHLLNAGGVDPGLSDLPPRLQAHVARQLATLGLIDRPTLAAVITEFARALDSVGHSFPAGLDGVLRQLAPHLSSDVVEALSAEAAMTEPALRGPALWSQVGRLDPEALGQALAREGDVVVAAALSRLDPERAAALLGDMPPERAEAVALAFARTGEVGTAALDRIGSAILRQVQAAPPRAFADAPEARAGSVLNLAGAKARGRILAALDAADPDFAAAVRSNIFGFEDIPVRLSQPDASKVLRAVDQSLAVAALKGAAGPLAAVADFLLGGLTSRLADQYREEVDSAPPPTEAETEAGMAAVVAAIRELEEAGEIRLLRP